MNTTIKEANRYLSNAKERLSQKANKTNGIYQDKKYVKMAGHTAYYGVLFALNQLIKPPKKNIRKSVDYYREFLAKYDKKMLTEFSKWMPSANNLYETLHLSLGYDGDTDVRISKGGLDMAKEFIGKVATRLN